MSNYYTKYEDTFKNKSSSLPKKAELKPKEVKKRIDEIAKRRSELKKLAKKDEIDNKLKSKTIETEQLVEVEDSDKTCVVCYKINNLYVAKCGHCACKPCWDTWLEKYLECPICRERTRKNQILPLSQEFVFKPK